MVIFSCVREEENIKSIPFDTIIGDYSGTSKTCMAQDIMSDTLCNSGSPNKFRVYIHNLTTINVSDETNKYDTLKLAYIKTVNTGNDAVHHFESKIGNASYTLMYADKNKLLTFENRIATDNNIITDYFIGNK